MPGELERALSEIVRREVEAALRRCGIEPDLETAETRPPAHSPVADDYPYPRAEDFFVCPRCGYEARGEHWSQSTSTMEATGHVTTETEIDPETGESRSVSRGWSVTRGRGQGYSEGIVEADAGDEDTPSGDKDPGKAG